MNYRAILIGLVGLFFVTAANAQTAAPVWPRMVPGPALMAPLGGPMVPNSAYPMALNHAAGNSGPSYTGPGDIVSGATAWYGLRAYNGAIAAAATQKLINIRNTATSETCDVIVTTNGGFGNVANCSGSSSGDTVAVFCAESGGPCAVTEAYDQSGNSNNATQGTAAAQPGLTLSCVNSLPCMTFVVGSNSRLAESAAISLSQPYTLSLSYERTGNFAANNYTFTGANGGFYATATEGFVGLNVNGFSGNIPASEPAFHNFAVLVNGGSSNSTVYVDGVSAVASTGTSTWANPVTIGAYSGDSSGLTGEMVEVGVWPGNQSASAVALCHNQYLYWGGAASC